jgi:hypothetical protein
VFEDHADGPLPNLNWIPLRRIVHDSILSKVGVSRKAGAVHNAPAFQFSAAVGLLVVALVSG